MKTIINEGLDYHDLKGQMEPFVSVDEYAAKMGKDKDVVTLAFIIKSKEAAKLNKPEIVDSALAVYNTIRWKLDGWVYQLSGDLVAANSPKKLRRLNYQTIESIEALCSVYLPAFSLISEMPANDRNTNLTTNVFYLIKDSYSLLKGLSDLKTQKTMAIVELLDQMRLANPQDILKQMK